MTVTAEREQSSFTLSPQDELNDLRMSDTVSYTHLTLPTIYSV